MSCVGVFLSALHSWGWIGILLARLAVGSLFCLSGRGKLFLPERREQMRQTLIEAHVAFVEFNVLLVSIVQTNSKATLIIHPPVVGRAPGVRRQAIANNHAVAGTAATISGQR